MVSFQIVSLPVHLLAVGSSCGRCGPHAGFDCLEGVAGSQRCEGFYGTNDTITAGSVEKPRGLAPTTTTEGGYAVPGCFFHWTRG